MEWGLKKADELGFESYLDATNVGIPLYETHGFVKAAELISMHQRQTQARNGRSFKGY